MGGNLSRDVIIKEAKAIISGLVNISVDNIDLEKDFYDLGLTSITIIDFVEMLNEKLKMSVGVESIFDYHGIDQLTNFIMQEQGINVDEEQSNYKQEAANEKTNEKIAIIGMCGRFGDCTNLDEYWKRLFGDDALVVEQGSSDEKHKMVLLKDRECFDAEFFGINSNDADKMDPQQRIFLETAYHALEDSGYPAESLSDENVGVFIGARSSDYKENISSSEKDYDAFLGNENSSISSRISYLYNLKGPSICIDTACSSGIASLHYASVSLKEKECDMALAGGIFIDAQQNYYKMAERSGLLAENGECHSLDMAASGMVLSEGAGIVVLKRLSEALADNNRIYGVISGSAVTQSGYTNGFGIPSMSSQKELLKKTYHNAKIDPQTISYIEANATATKLGDAIELNALKDFFTKQSKNNRKCAIGTSKTSVGHAVMASGMSGVLKILLGFQNGVLPATAGFKEINENVKLENSMLYIPNKPFSFQCEDGVLRAAINSFGLSGTNVHMIFEKQTQDVRESQKKEQYMFPVSARTKAALWKKIVDLKQWLVKNRTKYTAWHLSNVLCTQRSHFEARCSFIARDLDDLLLQIQKKEMDSENFIVVNEKRKVSKKVMDRIQTVFRNLDKEHIKRQYRKDLKELQSIYLDGYMFSLGPVFSNEKVPAISFQQYPFERTKHWIRKGEALGTDTIKVIYPKSIPNVIYLLADKKENLPIEKAEENRGLQMNGFEENICEILLSRLITTGVVEQGSISIERVEENEMISSMYISWLKETLRVLERNGYLHKEGEIYNVVDNKIKSEEEMWASWKKKKSELSNIQDVRPQIQLMEATLNKLDKVLTQKITSAEVMFPNSSLDLVVNIYKNNLVADYYNATLANSIIKVLQKRIELGYEEPVRILEIGAGTGGTSQIVLEKLNEYQKYVKEYCYTDVSKAFLEYGEQHFSENNSFMEYKLFNVEDSSSAYQIGINKYDFVIASNVLHATKDIMTTLVNVKTVLRQNGILFLNELSSKSLFTHVTFGLLEGWWKPKDLNCRVEGSPVILPEMWNKILENSGYSEIVSMADEEYGQQIILAESNGILEVSDWNMAGLDKKPQNHTNQDKQLVRKNETETKEVTEDEELEFVKSVLRKKVALGLMISEADILDDTPLREMGFDSILSVALIEEINRVFAVEFNTTVLFDYVTIDQLAEYLCTDFADKIADKVEIKHTQEQIIEADDEINQKTMEESNEDIAIIGFSGRFGDCETKEKFWEMLQEGKEAVTTLDRWSFNQKDNAKAFEKAALLKNIDQFDPYFFNISGKEAKYMDPQQRIFLEEAWKAMEHAGYCGDSSNGLTCGVYVACGNSDYLATYQEELPSQTFWGNMSSVIAARIAYYLNLKGPAISVDTACSSSLVAIHMACQGLWTGETDMALAGGVSVQCTPNLILSEGKVGMLSADSKCYTFDDRANGFAYGEGAGSVVLKRKSDAIADGDTIYGVIRGSGINQDGATNGLTAPSAKSQEKLIQDVYHKFKINPEKIQMFEAHGTGTKLGDPIEFLAATKAFQTYTSKQKYCAIGSVKTNIGHTQYAAGIASVIKVLLCLQHKKIAASLNFEQGNSQIDFENTPFFVNTNLREWQCGEGEVRQAAISSFGASGTNAHLVIAEAPLCNKEHKEEKYLVVLSAKTDIQLLEQIKQFACYLKNLKINDLGNISYTSLVGRRHMKYRFAVIGTSVLDVSTKVEGYLKGIQQTDIYQGEISKIDASVKRMGEEALEGKQLNEVARHYILGCELSFEKLFVNGDYGRIEMPAYPFAKESYWIEPKEVKVQYVQEDSFSTNEVKCFTEEWTNEQEVKEEKIPESLLCLVQDKIQQEEIERVFKSRYSDIKLLFALQNQASGTKEEYIRIFNEVKQSINCVSGIVHMWFMEKEKDTADAMQMSSLVQALSETGLSSEQILYAGVYRNEWEKALLEGISGFAASLKSVNPEWKLCVISEDAKETANLLDWNKWAERIWRELCNLQKESVSYRNNIRYTMKLAETDYEMGEDLLQEEGVYFITGGAGKLLFELEKKLAAKYHAKMILMGRSQLNETIQSNLEHIKELGGQAIYIQGNVDNIEDVKKAVQAGKNEYANIHGVIHGAGVQGEGTVLSKTWDEMMEVISPKIEGIRILEEVFATENIRFYCYVSSVSAVIGDFGGCDYAMANRFMLSYAQSMNRKNDIARIAIAWPMWEDGKMGITGKGKDMYFSSTGLRPLETEEGVNLWIELMKKRRRMDRIVLAGKKESVDRIAKHAGKLGRIDCCRKEELKENRSIDNSKWDIVNSLKMIASKQLEIPEKRIDVMSNLSDFGFDSISLADFAKAIQEHFGISFTPSLFYSYPTIDDLTAYLASKYKNKLSCRKDSEKKEEAFEYYEAETSVVRKKTAEARTEQEDELEKKNSIAVIGLSGRFPEARTAEELWSILEEGKSAVKTASEERFPQDRALIEKWKCGWVPGVYEFEPLFFEISPKEAEMMDPRHRLLMQETWRALEDAGCSKEDLEQKIVGMFVGAESSDYNRDSEDNTPITADHEAVLSSRLAYYMNFTGPNMTINTACSSGLTAFHQACQSLKNGECDMAVASGVNLILQAKSLEKIDKAGMISKSNTCFAFDHRADGMVPAEAVVSIVLKPLSKAERDGNPIYAVVRGSGVNYDGKTNGITSPNGLSQQRLIEQIYTKNQIDPNEISYVLAHGTGTKLGDPIEVNALYDAYKHFTDKENYCALTSAKTNFGHAFAASGLLSIVALIKSMEHKKIPASLNLEEKNSYINWEHSPFYVNTELKEWHVEEGKKRVGAVSAFGMSGTNVHVVLEQYQENKQKQISERPVMIVLSAKKKDSLLQKVTELKKFLQETEESLQLISNTLQYGRTHFDVRIAFTANTKEDALSKLDKILQEQEDSDIYQGKIDRESRIQESTTNFIHEITDAAKQRITEPNRFRDVLKALANLYCMGYTPTDEKGQYTGKRIHMPGYPFERTEYLRQNRKKEKPVAVNVELEAEKPVIECLKEAEKEAEKRSQAEYVSITELKENRAERASITELKEKLREMLAEALYVEKEEVNEKTKFIELGLDSIVGIEWIKAVNMKYHLNIGTTKIYDYPTINSFAQYVYGLLDSDESTRESNIQKKMIFEDTQPESKEPVLARKTIPNQEKDIEDKLLKSLQEALYVDLTEEDKKKNFIELGLDSIIGIEWIKDINNLFGIKIPASKMYDYPNIKKFAKMIETRLEEADISSAEEEPKLVKEESKESAETEEMDITPDMLGNPLFQDRYHCKWSYYAGAMANGISSIEMVQRMADASLLSIFGSGGYRKQELENKLDILRSTIDKGKPYGTCFIANISDERKEFEQAELFVKFDVPVIEVAACTSITESLVYLRLKNIRMDEHGIIVFPRRLIGKCSRIEVAKQFMSNPPKEYVRELVQKGLLTEEEARIAAFVSMTDDIVVEADSGGHTDQGVREEILPPIIDLRDSFMEKYKYQEEIMIGCGGGIGTPEDIAEILALGAEFILTGSINQCTIESGASPIVKDILCELKHEDTAYAIAGDMFEIGAKVQVVQKGSAFATRANALYDLFMQYDSMDEVPEEKKRVIEQIYFKKTLSEVWNEIVEHKQKSNPKDLEEASINPRFKMALYIKWYHAFCNKITLEGREQERENFEIFCGPAMGRFNQYVEETNFEEWQKRHVDEIANLLMEKTCMYMMKNGYFNNQMHLSEIAVVGMAANFPKAENVNEYWNNLISGKNCVTDIPDYRWNIKKYWNQEKENRGTYFCNKMGVLDNIDKFDAELFQIPPVEAMSMDPQQRKFLENCWLCIEDAGMKPSKMENKKCSVFVGCGSSGYQSMIDEKDLDSKVLTGNVSSTLAARISYLLDLKGASISVETACSSSLVAISQACDSLVLHNCDYALAGGVCILAEPSLLVMSSKAGMLSEDGACHTFDERANGFVPGEGVGVVMLKRLSDAIRDNDRIYGVIKGWGINQDGRTNGITAPSVISQTQLEKDVYNKFHINPEKITYVEAHGTGTKLGDPIEVEALTESFKEFTEKKNYCAIGSVKSNIGHLMAAAGVASVIKVLLAMQNKLIPPTIHYSKLNEHIDMKNSPFYVADKLEKWNTDSKSLRCAAVSAFGFSGTNCHLVIEEYPQRNMNRNEFEGCGLFVLSAQSEQQLRQYADRMASHLNKEKDVCLDNVLYTLQNTREELEEKLAFVISSKDSLIVALRAFADGTDTTRIRNVDGLATSKANEYLKLAKKWISGEEIEWDQYNDGKIHFVSLPQYPLKKRAYWVKKKEQSDSASEALDKSNAQEVEDIFKAEPEEINQEADVKIKLGNNIVFDEIETGNIKINLSGIAASFEVPKEEKQDNTKEIIQDDTKTGDLDRDVKKILIRSLAEVLYEEESNINESKEFTDMGVDSILGIEWIKKLNKEFNQTFSATMLYEYTNITELESYLKQFTSKSDPKHESTVEKDIQQVVENEQDCKRSTRDKLIETLADCMYMQKDEVNVTKNFMDMGVDSILGIEWLRRIRKQYSWNMDITVLYDHPTILELAQYIDSIHQEEEMEEGLIELDQLLNQVYEGKVGLEEAEENLGKVNLTQI